MKANFYFFLLLVLLANSCVEPVITIPEFTLPTSDRVVLVEELTGVQCPNCPAGAAAVENMLKNFEGKVVAVAVHGRFLSAPLPQSKYDFRNKAAEDLENWHRPFIGKPCALINRAKFNGEDYVTVDNIGVWQSYATQELQKPHVLDVFLDYSYDPATRRLELEVLMNPLVDQSSEAKISVFITESGMVDYQKNQNVIIPDYVHNHVLRDMMTAFDGDALATLTKGQTQRKNYTYTIPQDWVFENLEIVVAVGRNTPNDRTILQAAAVKTK